MVILGGHFDQPLGIMMNQNRSDRMLERLILCAMSHASTTLAKTYFTLFRDCLKSFCVENLRQISGKVRSSSDINFFFNYGFYS